MNFLKFIFPFFLFILITTSNWGQQKTSSFILNDSLNVNFTIKEIHTIEDLNQTLNNKGYYFYTSELIQKDSIDTYNISLGRKTSILKIKNTSNFIKNILKTKKEYNYVSPNNLNIWLKQITNEFDKEGENFTEIELKNQQFQNDTLYCDLQLKESNKRFINKTIIKGYNRFSKRFLKYYIKSRKPFSKELLEETEQKINQLTFVQNKQKPAVLFTKDSTYLYLYLEKIKANKLDALIGFSNQEGQDKIQFNGYIDLSLTNTLHKGETFAFKWNNSGQDQQEIDLNIDNPYIFNTPINLGYQLNIFRQDSTFVNTKQFFNLSYRPHFKHLLRSYYSTETSTTITNITNNTEYKKNFIGLGYEYKVLNKWKIPKVKIEFEIAYGNKKTTEATQQQTFKSDIIYNIEISPSNHFYIQNRNAYLRSNNISNNELYRIGGATTMRGFLEQSILSHLYNYANFEYRYFNNPISYLYAFTDVGQFRNSSNKNNLVSLGLGYTLGTPSGLLKISYAVGKNQDTTFNLSNGLFHINFVTIF